MWCYTQAMTSNPFDMDNFEKDIPSEPIEVPVIAPYLKGLNDSQNKAVDALDGPVLVLAGAGTGKTRVLTTRLTHLIETGKATPDQILSVTFTNKAAAEMRERVSHILGRPIEGMAIGTFHSICAKWLRVHADLVGLKSDYTILDTDDQIRLLKQILKTEQVDMKRWPAKHLAGLIDRWKNKAMHPKAVPEGEAQSFANGLGGELYKTYQARLRLINCCDYGDLILHIVTIFQKHPDVLKKFQSRYQYILVDEYQDTNLVQYLWLRILAQLEKNICCVGDDDQSIYGWRGAEIGNILKFEKDFPGAEVIKLEQNYRSTSHILGAASGLISINSGRLGKTLWTKKEGGDLVTVKSVWDGGEEAKTIGDEVRSLQSKGKSLKEMVVLVRAGFQTREFEEHFITLGIPYRVVGGPRFYERREIRDALSYLRVVNQANDDLAFERIINVPKRGLGNFTIQKIHKLARAHNVSMVSAARQIIELDELRPQTKKTLGDLLDDLVRWREANKTLGHQELAEIILDESGYNGMWQADESPDSPGRIENLSEFVGALGEFESLEEFLEHISLVMENDAEKTLDKISIMTLHASKGLEFDFVFLPGWEESVFPNQMALDESGLSGLEEERRLAYVGLTRAREKAYILHAASRMVFGKWQDLIPSRFIDELPEEHIEKVSDLSNFKGHYPQKSDGYETSIWGEPVNYENQYRRPNWQRFQNKSQSLGDKISKAKKGSAIEKRTRLINKEKKNKSTFSLGERVFHDKFGYGIIEGIEGNKLDINFEGSGPKKIMDSFVVPKDKS